MDPHFLPDGSYRILDQQQELLYPTRFPEAGNTSTYISDHLEIGGNRIEETLHRLNCHYQSLFFLASWSVLFSAFLGFISSIYAFDTTTLISSCFLFVFGCTTLVMDIPGNPRWAGRYRRCVRKYARFLTRLTGKSLFLFYLGCMISISLWPNGYNKKPLAATILLAFTLSTFVICIACLGLFVAFRKSARLERVRKALFDTYQASWPEVYRKYAVNDPAHGIQFDEFNRMVSDYSNGKILFDLSDLQIIYNALDEHQKNAINESEFGQWVAPELLMDSEPFFCIARNMTMTYL